MTLAQQYISSNLMTYELDPGSYYDQIGDISITWFTDGSVVYSDCGCTSTGREFAMWWGFAGRGFINHPTTD